MKKRTLTTKAYRMVLVLMVAACMLVAQGVALAATMPEYVSLGSVVDKASKPTAVAVDSKGRLFLAEPTKDRVAVFTQSGNRVGSINGIAKPNTVAADGDDNILVGNSQNGSVAVFGSTLAKLFDLGSGAGEFDLATDIAAGDTGHVYVADPKTNTVKIYNGANGAFVASIGTAGTVQLFQPIAVAVNNATGELFVLDGKQVFDRLTRSMIRGAGINVYTIGTDAQSGDTTWTWSRSYDKFGTNRNGGDLKMPKSIDVDAQGRVYVTDTYIRPVVMVYDAAGAFLGLIPVDRPNDMAISGANILYIANFPGEKVDAFGLDSFGASLVAPSPLVFEAIEGGNDPAAQTMKISNLGNTQLDWNAAAGETWLAISSTADSLATGAESTVDVSVTIAGLAVGSYTGQVNVTTAGGVEDHVAVTLKVDPNPLVIEPASITVATTEGTTPSTQTLQLKNISTGQLSWKASADQSWISLSASEGAAPGNVKVYFDSDQMTAGTYNATITFTHADGSNPVDVPVEMTIEAGDETPDEVPGLPVAGGKGVTIAGKHWQTVQVLPAGSNLNGVWGTDRKNVVAVGDNGAIFSFDGKDWSQETSGITSQLNSVWGTDSAVYAVGAAGTVLSNSGSGWTTVATGSDDLQDIFGSATGLAVGPEFRSIWGSSETDIFVVGESGLVNHSADGTTFAPMVSGTTAWLNSVWGSSATDVFAVGENGTIIHYDGTAWSTMASGTTRTLQGVWGSGPNDVFAVGADAVVLHYDGTAWTTLMATDGMGLNDVWVSDKSFVVAVGNDGLILTAGKSKFPWTKIIVNIAENAKRQKKNNK